MSPQYSLLPTIREPTSPEYSMLPLKPYADEDNATLVDDEQPTEDERLVDEERPSQSKKESTSCCGDCVETCIMPILWVTLVVFFGLVAATVSGIFYGATLVIEYGLTGQSFLAPGHDSLFRICESSSTTGNIFDVHTCNVFRPNQPVDDAPIHSFAIYVRPWQSIFDWSGWAVYTDPVSLDDLLLSRGLKCTSKDSEASSTDDTAQIMVGGVGQSWWSDYKTATACTYNGEGENIQSYCAVYEDGGRHALAWSHPLSINAIMEKHFGRNCTWV